MGGKSIASSVLISIILTTGICILVIPLTTPTLFPDLINEKQSLKDQIEELNKTITSLNDQIQQSSDDGIILQSITKNIYSQAFIEDSQLNNIEIPDTNLTISIKDQSKIFATFSSYSRIGFNSGVSGYLSFNVTLSLEGVGNSSLQIAIFEYSDTIDRTFPYHIYLNYESNQLSAGDYVLKVFYKSNADLTGFNNYLLLSQGGEYNPRTLLAQEIKTQQN